MCAEMVWYLVEVKWTFLIPVCKLFNGKSAKGKSLSFVLIFKHAFLVILLRQALHYTVEIKEKSLCGRDFCTLLP